MKLFILLSAILLFVGNTNAIRPANTHTRLNIRADLPFDDPKLNQSCSIDSQCRLKNTVCLQGKCQCQLGYLDYHKTVCRAEYCEEDAICGRLFGDNTVCLEHQCVCSESAQLAVGTKQCIPKMETSFALFNGTTLATLVNLINNTNTINTTNLIGYCAMGYLTGNSTIENCKPVNCTSDRVCNLVYGPNTVCNTDTSTCTCDEAHQYDPQTKRCSIRLGPSIGYACFSSSDCSSLYQSECIQGTCQCPLGYQASSENNSCIETFCGSEPALCITQFGPNTVCNGWRCQCVPSFKLDTFSRTCTPDPLISQLNSTCTFDNDCGDNAGCLNNHCKCLMGNVPDATGFNCQQYPCATNNDCIAQFNASGCSFGTCGCNWDQGYKLVTNNQTCALRAKKIGQSCYTSGDCGNFADCIYGQCKCSFGFTMDENDMDCSSVNCNTDGDCQVLDINSQCIFNSCSCQSGYLIDYLKNVCTLESTYWGDDDDYDYDYTAPLLASALIITVLLSILLAAIRVRRAQAIVARRPVVNRPPPYTGSFANISLPEKSGF